MRRGWLLSLALLPLAGGCGEDDEGVLDPNTYSRSLTLDTWCEASPSPCCGGCSNAPALELSFVDADTRVSGPGRLTLRISGDLDDDVDETLRIAVEGLDLGVVFNGNPDDDAFDLINDRVTDCTETTLRAVLPMEELIPIAADGVITVTLTPDPDLSEIDAEGCPAGNEETLTLTISYPF